MADIKRAKEMVRDAVEGGRELGHDDLKLLRELLSGKDKPGPKRNKIISTDDYSTELRAIEYYWLQREEGKGNGDAILDTAVEFDKDLSTIRRWFKHSWMLGSQGNN